VHIHDDWKKLTLQTWARWVSRGRELHFSTLGDSVAAREVFLPKHKRTFRSDEPLWREGGDDFLHELDGRLVGALGERGRLVLLAACIPLGRPCPATERAAAAGVSVEQMRAVRRRAMALID